MPLGVQSAGIQTSLKILSLPSDQVKLDKTGAWPNGKFASAVQGL